MGAVDFVVALEQQMELVPLKRGWWVAFGGPHTPTRAAAAPSVGEPEASDADAPEAARPQPGAARRSQTRQRAGTVPPTEPKRRRRHEPQPPSPRPMPDPAPVPVPDPPSAPDLPDTPRDSRGGRR